MRRFSVFAVWLVMVPALTFAHVSVSPDVSKPDGDDVRTPNGLDRAPRHQTGVPTGEAAAIEKWLAEYDAAFNAKDLEKLGTFYHPDVTIYEGGGIDNGWPKYRDGHLGPELKAFENLQFGHTNRQIQVMADGKTAYALSTYALKAKMGERVIDSGGLETLILVKAENGAWKIRHSHTSSRPRRQAQ
ncbi:MAG: nuclear transport factor 2 family protein [Acidobacteria bacterium]|nr:nuclear transport factor 2 family protein [Acidobacteriota bacterium]